MKKHGLTDDATTRTEGWMSKDVSLSFAGGWWRDAKRQANLGMAPTDRWSACAPAGKAEFA